MNFGEIRYALKDNNIEICIKSEDGPYPKSLYYDDIDKVPEEYNPHYVFRILTCECSKRREEWDSKIGLTVFLYWPFEDEEAE